MKKVYTYADRYGSKLFVREAFRDGDKIVRVANAFTDYRFEMFVPASRGIEPDSKTIHGSPLSRIEFENVRSLIDFTEAQGENWDLHGMEDPVIQWVAKEYPGVIEPDVSLFSVFNFDIEVAHDDGFPEPSKADEEVLSITFKRFGQAAITLGTKECSRERHLLCSDEKHLLQSFVELWEREYPDFVTGWNVQNFDVTYMVNRIRKVCGETWVRRLSPFHKKSKDVIFPREDYLGEPYYKILGITTVDYLELYKKFSPEKRESYRLDYIAQVELGEGKVDFSEYGGSLMKLYRMNYFKFVEYNERDVLLVERLDAKLSFIQNLVAVAFMVKGRFDDAQATVKPWDSLVYNKLLELGMQPPPHPKTKPSNLVGGYVKEPTPGLKKWVVTLDLASLYPNIVRTLNMSPETIVHRGEPIVEEILKGEDVRPEGNLAIAANGSAYSQDQEGIIPMLMGYLLDRRNVVKGEMKDAKRDIQRIKKEIEVLSAKEHDAT